MWFFIRKWVLTKILLGEYKKSILPRKLTKNSYSANF